MTKTMHLNVNMSEACPRCGELGATIIDGKVGLCLDCAAKKAKQSKLTYENLDNFTPAELSLLTKNADIFNDANAGTCKECKIAKAVSGGPCLDCLESKLQKGDAVSFDHLPERWPADAAMMGRAKELISRHMVFAEKAAIAYLMKLKHGETNGKVILGTCAKQSPKNKLLHGWDYIIEISWDMWALMNTEQRDAILLHELCHICEDDKGWKIEAHNVEEFIKVIQVYGLWKPDLKHFAEAIRRAEAADESQKELFKRQQEIKAVPDEDN